jgi:predicted MFS family arabinose efflux permease
MAWTSKSRQTDRLGSDSYPKKLYIMRTPKPPSLWLLIVLSALAVLPINMFIPSLPSIARDLAADFAVVNLAVAGYAVVSAIIHLGAGALSDRFGRRPVVLFALAIFTLASAGCSVATDIQTFLLCRLFQGAIIAVYTVCLTAVRETSGDRAVAGRIGYVSSAWAVAPMVGPTIGGLLDTYFGWRANFIAFTALGGVALYLAAFQFGETNISPSRSISRQINSYAELSRSPLFWAYAICMAFSIGTLYVFLGGAPLVAKQLAGVSSASLGIYMGIVPAGFIVGSSLVSRLSIRQTPINLILTGRVLTCVGLLVGLTLCVYGVVHPLAFFGPCLCVGLGNGLTMPAANASVLSLRPDLAGTALGFAAALTVAGAGIIAFFSGLIVQPSNANVAVLGMMLASSALSLIAAMVLFLFQRQGHGLGS